MKIKSIKAYEILDSRGNPTIKVVLKIGKHFLLQHLFQAEKAKEHTKQ